LRRADPPSKEPYQNVQWIHIFLKLNSESEQVMMAYVEVNDEATRNAGDSVAKCLDRAATACNVDLKPCKRLRD
jgi:hypothetical protein